MSDPIDTSTAPAAGIPEPGAKAPSIRLRRRRLAAFAVLALLAAAVLGWSAGSAVVAGAVECGACHSMSAHVTAAAGSTHAGLECAECHVGEGAGAVFAAGPRGTRWMLVSLLGREPSASDVPDTRCRECHAAALEQVVEARGIRVRHSDFADAPCGSCHPGVAHPLEDRHYIGTQMADCTACHRTSALQVETCGTCHVGDGEGGRGASAWRVVHGPNWRSTHGMGTLAGCTDCHAPSYCAQCHGLALPHPAEWARSHGTSAAEDRGACERCHDPAWCSECHGVEMPHPNGFMPAHPGMVRESGPSACYRCHTLSACEHCHVRSSHPPVDGVRTDAHGGGER